MLFNFNHNSSIRWARTWTQHKGHKDRGVILQSRIFQFQGYDPCTTLWHQKGRWTRLLNRKEISPFTNSGILRSAWNSSIRFNDSSRNYRRGNQFFQLNRIPCTVARGRCGKKGQFNASAGARAGQCERRFQWDFSSCAVENRFNGKTRVNRSFPRKLSRARKLP